uniref:Uncharacterized protein n=1 Tax=uncultured prokaryote TaxID=198431 RepID=H5SPW6_9ZZZZ|nr:hypothetical protein HGMM_F55D02C02 [uncultured prokaryote]
MRMVKLIVRNPDAKTAEKYSGILLLSEREKKGKNSSKHDMTAKNIMIRLMFFSIKMSVM